MLKYVQSVDVLLLNCETISFPIISFTTIELTVCSLRKSFILASCIGMLFTKSHPIIVRNLLNMSTMFAYDFLIINNKGYWIYGWMFNIFIHDGL